MKLFVTFTTILFTTISFSQKDDHIYDFFGGKTTANKTVFYRLLFQINNDKLTGYAFTDEQGTQETKSLINGTFNSKTKTIVFSETKKILTKSRQTFDELCYLNGTVSFDLKPSISIIKGTFIEKTINKQQCSSGTIEIISPNSYNKLKKTIALEEKLLVTSKEILDVTAPTFASNEKITIKDDEKVTVFWNSDKFVLDIWDDAKEDNDQITIKFNDEVILKKYTLKNKKKTLEFNLIKGENKIIFTANNTGFIANNTARVDLFDDKIKHQIVTKLKLNKSVTVFLVRE